MFFRAILLAKDMKSMRNSSNKKKKISKPSLKKFGINSFVKTVR